MKTFLPLVSRLGPNVSAVLDRPGFYPAGGGRFTINIEPATKLDTLEVLERGQITRRSATAIVANLPRFIITDHGCQYRTQFRNAMKALGVTQVRGRVRSPLFNGKVERFFRTLRQWLRVVLLPMTVRGIQARLNRYRDWFNTHRVHQAIDGLTSDEAVNRSTRDKPTAFHAIDNTDPIITVERLKCRGDPHLPVVRIEVKLRAA